MKTAITTIILILLPFTLAAETPFEAYVEAVASEHYDTWDEDERFLFLLGFAAGQQMLLVDLAPILDGDYTEYTILPDDPDTIRSHLLEIMATPNFRNVPLPVMVQLSHHYVWQIRHGYQHPVAPSEE